MDEDNHWAVSKRRDSAIEALLADEALLEIRRNGEPGHLDARMKYANALVAALPGSSILTPVPGNRVADTRKQY